MEVARPIVILVGFVVLLMMIVYTGAGSISATEISRSSNVSDTLHQAIESMTLDVLIAHVDKDALKDFIVLVPTDDISKIDKEIREGIDRYLRAFPDIALNTDKSFSSVAGCMKWSAPNLSEAHSTMLGALNINISPGTYTYSGGKYKQTDDQLPKIKVSSSMSAGHPSDLPNAVLGYYIPPARQAVGSTLLPIAFQVSVQAKFLEVGSTASDDTRDKNTNSNNASSIVNGFGKTSNSVDSAVNFNAADGSAGINTAMQINPENGEYEKQVQGDGSKALFYNSKSGW